MKSLLLIVIFYLVSYYSISNNYGVVRASSNISRDRIEYIKKQFALRSQAVHDQFNKFANDANNIYSDDKDDTLCGVTSTMNCLTNVLDLFCGGIISSALQISTSILDIAQNYAENSKQGEIGYTIARGVKGLIDQEISSFNTKHLGAVLEGINDKMTDFYTSKTNGQFNIFQESSEVDEEFIENKAQFQKCDFRLDTIGLFTLYANSHLLFLYNMITSGPEKYNFNSSQIEFYKNRLNSKITEYREYIDKVDVEGLEALNKKIKDNGIKNQDEWNERNDYYNFMKLYVYDISNYWSFLDPIRYPNGMFIENAHVTLSKLFGAPFNGVNHLSALEIDKYLENNNAYQYQGKLQGVYYKNYNCRKDGSNFNLVKYFGGRQFFFRDNQERDTKYLGDEGRLAGDKYYTDLSGKSVDSVVQYLSRDKGPKSFSRDYHWGLSINGINIGDVSVYRTRSILSYPEKSVTSVLPISYGKCSIGCSGKEKTDYLVESAIIGFVNSDITYDNIVFELTGSMIDAQKYFNYSKYDNRGVSYSKNGNYYKQSILVSRKASITYKVIYNPYDGLIGNFRFQLDLRIPMVYTKSPGYLEIKLQISTSNSTSIETSYISFFENYRGQIYDTFDINLYPSIDNYITIEFSDDVNLSSLIFVPVQ